MNYPHNTIWKRFNFNVHHYCCWAELLRWIVFRRRAKINVYGLRCDISSIEIESSISLGSHQRKNENIYTNILNAFFVVVVVLSFEYASSFKIGIATVWNWDCENKTIDRGLAQDKDTYKPSILKVRKIENRKSLISDDIFVAFR